MRLMTTLPREKGGSPIGYNSRIVALGSCFAQSMADKFLHFGLGAAVNPFGILFQPQALERAIDFAMSKRQFTAADVFLHNGRWHCYDAHSIMSRDSAYEAVAALNQASVQLHDAIRQASHIVITLGSAWQYRLKTTGNTVANCHKIPSTEFDKEIAGVDNIAGNLTTIINLVKSVNADVTVIFTVSPVRHLKDGFAANQQSKAHLITALHQFLSISDNAANCKYFPAFEIVMDELRDYRFYATDMLHPNSTAIDYIWQIFVQTWIDPAAIPIMDEVDSVRRALAHRPVNPLSSAHSLFVDELHERVKVLQRNFRITL